MPIYIFLDNERLFWFFSTTSGCFGFFRQLAVFFDNWRFSGSEKYFDGIFCFSNRKFWQRGVFGFSLPAKILNRQDNSKIYLFICISSLAVVPDCPPGKKRNQARSAEGLKACRQNSQIICREWVPVAGCAYRNNTHEVEEKRSAAYGCCRFSTVLLHN